MHCCSSDYCSRSSLIVPEYRVVFSHSLLVLAIRLFTGSTACSAAVTATVRSYYYCCCVVRVLLLLCSGLAQGCQGQQRRTPPGQNKNTGNVVCRARHELWHGYNGDGYSILVLRICCCRGCSKEEAAFYRLVSATLRTDANRRRLSEHNNMTC